MSSTQTRIRLVRAAMLVVALTLVLFVLAATGCGGNSASLQTATTAATETTETPIPAPPQEPGQETPEQQEQPSPYGQGSTEPQTVGTLIDGLQLKNIRYADHGTYYRIVFEMATPDGQPVLQVPHAETSLNGRVIKVILGGIRSIGDNPSVTSTDLTIGDTLVTSLVRVPSGDDQALIYEINLTQPTTYSLAGLGSPGRIIIDVNKV